jgi:hypothetical protein
MCSRFFTALPSGTWTNIYLHDLDEGGVLDSLDRLFGAA